MRTLRQVLRATAAALALLTAGPPASAAEPPRVLASISPIASLAAAVMRGVGEPAVLLPRGASPHAYSMRPSDARALASADLVLWVGESLEAFLEEPLQTLGRPGVAVELIDTEGLTLHETRSGGVWEAGDDGHGHGHAHGHSHGHADGGSAADAHIWLDPGNAIVLTRRIAAELAARDPARADRYRTNAETAVAAIEALDRELEQTLAAVADRPYVVFHDAYQYLEQRYGLFPIGAVTIGPERAAGAQRVRELREAVVSRGATCVFREPGFSPKLLDALAADTKVKVGVLDPEGLDIAPGPDGYGELMRRLAAALTGCLAAGG